MDPLISICIPTYNRADVLRQSLESYVNNGAFDDEIEIVISDNASTDKTQEIGEHFASKYRNIKYFRNIENVRDANFPLSLDRGTGRYLKLMKDNLIISADGLSYMKDMLKKYDNEEIPVFFTCGVLFNSEEKVYQCSSFDDFVIHLSYYVTALWVFGCWKSSWGEIKDKQKYSNLMLAQDDWFYQLVYKYNRALLITEPFVKETIEVGSRGGYNWFEIHVDNYYSIMRPYYDNSILSKRALLIEKKTRLKGLMPFIPLKYICNTRPYWGFDMDNTTKILWNNFKDVPYFYWLILTFPFWSPYYVLKFPVKKIICKLGLLR